MRWTKKRYRDGDKITKTFFAWLPISHWSETTIETRWLETVTVEYTYMDLGEGGHEWLHQFV